MSEDGPPGDVSGCPSKTFESLQAAGSEIVHAAKGCFRDAVKTIPQKINKLTLTIAQRMAEFNRQGAKEHAFSTEMVEIIRRSLRVNYLFQGSQPPQGGSRSAGL